MNTGNIRKIDYLMSYERDFPIRTKSRYRYALLSTPRCGSNMVSDMLHQTGVAGDPLEYLNSRFIAGYLRLKGRDHSSPIVLSQYLEEMESRRTSKNGYFGIKIHFEHMARVFSDTRNFLDYLNLCDRVIFLRRRDKISQAVSLYKARVTQIWSSMDYEFIDPTDPRLSVTVGFDPVAIGRALADVLTQEFGWEALLRRHNIEHKEVWYEDLTLDFSEKSGELLSYLQLSDFIGQIRPPRTQKQGGDTQSHIRQFRQILCVD